MKHGKTYDWIPLYIDKWIFGSTRIELDPAERGVFIDLMALAAKDDGYVRANPNMAYLPHQLAGLLNIPIDLLNQAIEKCIQFKKITRDENGILYVSSWGNYSLSERHRRRFMSGKADMMSAKSDGMSEISAKSGHYTKTDTETNTDTDIKNNGRKTGPLAQTEIDKKFEEFWTAYPREGRLAKKESRVKFGALVKRNELAEFIKGFHGYLDYLKHQKVKNKFDQRPMYAKTFVNGRWQEFVGFKYEAEL